MNPTRGALYATLRTIDPDQTPIPPIILFARDLRADRASKGARRAAVRGKGNAGAACACLT